MAFGRTLVLCSPFAGKAVTEDGQAAAGIEIERRWTWGWNDETGSDRTVTDAQGHFELPKVTGSSLTASLMPHEPDVRQSIIARTPKGEVEIWNASKRSYDLNSELDGRPIRVVCHVDREPSADGLYWGTCVEDK